MATTQRTKSDDSLTRQVCHDVSEDIVIAAAQQAVREAVVDHLKNGRSVPFEKDGKVVWQHPDGSVRDTP